MINEKRSGALIDIAGKSIPELQKMMESGETTARELVIGYLKRIRSYNLDGIGVNAVAEINPDAILIAESLDRERKWKGSRGPMHGIPVMLKDNISTCDKMHTTAGSVALADNIAKADAPLVAKLRDAGAIILGKTNLSEFACYMALKFKNGYSSRGGQVYNPYGRQYDVSGSSSGSAVAASCDFCAAAVGTETAGSITCPSMNNSICGLKPTVGLISRSGIIPICNQDTAGPMGRTVEDCAVMLGALVTGEEPGDAATYCTDHLICNDYVKFLKKDGLRGLRIGVNRIRCEPEMFPEDSPEIFEEALEQMQQEGVELISCDIPYTGLEDGILSQATLLYEYQNAMDAYLARYGGGRCKTMKDIINYNQRHAETALRFGQDLLLKAQFETSGRLIDNDYWDAKLDALNKGGENGIDRVIREKKVDVIVCAGYSNLPPLTGYPVMAVPMGFAKNGLPVGLSFYAGAFQEPLILQAAYAYEQICQKRRPPDLGQG